MFVRWRQCSLLSDTSLVPSTPKNGKAPGTHCLCMHLISPGCGDSGLFWILPFYMTSVFGLDSIPVRIIIAFDAGILTSTLRLNELQQSC